MTDVTIVNIALTQLGAETLLSLADNSENARRATVIFEPVRDEVLRAHPWNFAVVRSSALSALATGPTMDWDYFHQIPSDCLRILKVSDGTNDIEDYEIEGRKIASNTDVLYIKYIKKEIDANQYDAMFVGVLAARIASELAYPVTASKTLAKTMYELYTLKKRAAKSIDGQESQKDSTVGADTWTINKRQ